MKKLIAGNWKMHGDNAMVKQFDTAMAGVSDHVDWLICTPFPYLGRLENVLCGAQDCSAYDHGAYTGEVSASMLRDLGCGYCIVGHSERRALHMETNDLVRRKAIQVIENGMTAIICIGETLEERESGKALDVVTTQIEESLPQISTAENVVIAYEPVWAIGTGKAATPKDVIVMHNHIRGLLKTILADGAEMRILYGGSVKPENAAELFRIDNVGGALIGGASLKADDFLAIGQAVEG